MTRQKFIYIDGKLTPASDAVGKSRTKDGIVGDELTGGIEHPANGEICYSKNRYKAISRAYDLEECYGEDPKYWRKADDSEQREKELEEDVVKSLAELEYGEGLSEEELELCRQKNQLRDWQDLN